MSIKGKQMDIHFQKWNLKRFLKSVWVAPDTIDVNSLLDSKLFYPENEKNVFKLLGISKKRY